MNQPLVNEKSRFIGESEKVFFTGLSISYINQAQNGSA